MKQYTLELAGARGTEEIWATSDAEAIDRAKQLLGGDPVVAEQWDADGWNDQDRPCKRILLWADEQSAENDSGANSIAQLSTLGSA